MVTTIARKSKNLLPADPTEQEFAALFPHLWDWIFKDPDGWHTNSKGSIGIPGRSNKINGSMLLMTGVSNIEDLRG